ncbi:MAG: hypothetical protein R2911_29035 [Caldilineaceae bacterium]
MSTHHDLTNGMLQNEDAAYLIPAILRTVAPGGAAAIDAYHLFALGVQNQRGEINSVRDWFFRPFGAGHAFFDGAAATLSAFAGLASGTAAAGPKRATAA